VWARGRRRRTLEIHALCRALRMSCARPYIGNRRPQIALLTELSPARARQQCDCCEYNAATYSRTARPWTFRPVSFRLAHRIGAGHGILFAADARITRPSQPTSVTTCFLDGIQALTKQCLCGTVCPSGHCTRISSSASQPRKCRVCHSTVKHGSHGSHDKCGGEAGRKMRERNSEVRIVRGFARELASGTPFRNGKPGPRAAGFEVSG
jgi:hypothetical protein